MGNRAIDLALKSAEQQQEKELTSRFVARMQASVRDIGQVGTIRHTILSHVAQENYDQAVKALLDHLDSKPEFPLFKVRAERYARYAVDLVNAVKAKRSFPGLQHLAVAKQQELFDRAMAHFDDLKATLRKIEQINLELRVEDVRSTVLVVRALVISVFAILALAFTLEVSRGILPTAWVVVDTTFGDMSNWVFDKLGM